MVSVLKNIAKAITSFFDVVGSLIDFAIDFIKDLVYVVKLVGEFVLKIPDMFNWLPGVAVTMIVTIFGVVVIYKIIGRE